MDEKSANEKKTLAGMVTSKVNVRKICATNARSIPHHLLRLFTDIIRWSKYFNVHNAP